MKIGIDVDGVILNFERELRVYGDLYNFLEFKSTDSPKKGVFYVQDRYTWTDEQKLDFAKKYFIKCSKECSFMAGAVDIIKRLKAEGHELVVISARGGMFPEMIDVALERLAEKELVFDKYFWNAESKYQIAVDEKLDFMIDDGFMHVEKLIERKIKTIYFRDVDMPVLKKNKYLYDATNWGEIYKILKINKK